MATVLRSRCAFLRLFAGKTGQILNNAIDSGTQLIPGSQSIYRKYANYANSPFVRKIKEQYEYEIVKNPPEWKYIERLMPFETIPKFTPKEEYPSGWVPPKEEAINMPYFIPRTKNLELPIYLEITYRGMRKISKIRNIEGDIWLMNDEIKAYLKKKNNNMLVETRVHEVARNIEAKGDHVNILREWAYSKGF